MKRAIALLAAVALMGVGCWGSTSMDVNPGGGTTGSGSAGGGGTGAGADASAAAKIQGSWKMMTFKKPTPGAQLQDVSGLNLTLTLGSDGKLTAKICNSMSGNYSYQDGKLTGPEVISTLMFCPGLPGEIEAAFVSDLTLGMSANAADGGLTLIGGKTLNVYMFGEM